MHFAGQSQAASRSARHHFFAVKLHFSLTLLGLVPYFLLTSEEQPDADIGAGLAIFWLALLGLPWSFQYFFGGFDNDHREIAYISGCALFNVALHLWRRWASWRRLPSSSA